MLTHLVSKQWISHRFASTNEGAKGDPWHYYHLYGLERVSSLLDVSMMGDHAWYMEGARYLVDKQDKMAAGWISMPSGALVSHCSS
ncbi:MAG: hypothetical protein ACI841_005467 [Planctomycetota bacterium]